jgi:hypothetical protein
LSPAQPAVEAADFRSDIFAFGVCLLQEVSGRGPSTTAQKTYMALSKQIGHSAALNRLLKLANG